MFRNYTILLFVLLLLIATSACYPQFISNASFEGSPQPHVPPPGWAACHEYSTPDTQPGFWQVYYEAAHGQTFISIVARGDLGPFANYNEDLQTQLLAPMLKGNIYDMNLALAHSTEFGHEADFDFVRYDTPIKLRIFGGVLSCERSELLWESPLIDHIDWKRYAFQVQPITSDINYLILEAAHAGSTTYFGNVLIDDMSLVFCNDEAPIATQPFDSLICENESLFIDASTPGGRYLWGDGSTDPSIIVTSAGVYTVEVYNGCDSQIFEYNIEEQECNCQIKLPNIFTPNLDGLNETFLIQGTPDIARYDLRIYDRWGQLVFQTKTIDDSWNGLVNGNTCPSGVYFWTVNLMCIIGGSSIEDRTYKGSVTVTH